MTSSEGQAPAWSIVVITLNEEDTIARCLQSVFEAFHGPEFTSMAARAPDKHSS
jgi:hypothetical protein